MELSFGIVNTAKPTACRPKLFDEKRGKKKRTNTTHLIEQFQLQFSQTVTLISSPVNTFNICNFCVIR